MKLTEEEADILLNNLKYMECSGYEDEYGNLVETIDEEATKDFWREKGWITNKYK